MCFPLSFTSVIAWMNEVAQSCLTLCNPMDCSLTGSSAHGILQARILEWVAICFSRRSSWPRDHTWVSFGSWIAGRFLTIEPPGKQNWRQKWQIEWREWEDFLARLYLKVWKYEWREAVFLFVKTGSGLYLEGKAKLVLSLRVRWI